MQKIKLFKKYSDGEVRSIEANETPNNMSHLLANGYFLTEQEAKTGKVADAKAEVKRPARKTAAKPVKIKTA